MLLLRAWLQRHLARIRSAFNGRPVRYIVHTTHALPPGEHELRLAAFEDRKGEVLARMKLASKAER